jgi:hypothetical protein
VSGLPPSDFDSWGTGAAGPGKWAVVLDEGAQGGRAIEQFSSEPIDERLALAIYKPFSGDNVYVQIRFKPVAGQVDRAGGIAVRLTTPDDYYVVRANALGDNVSFYRVVKGMREQLAGADTKIKSNEWHTLSLSADGAWFTIAFDGKQLFTATDTTFMNPGKLALWTKADSVIRFDWLDIHRLP